jgi:hypothetical protein
MASAAVSFSRDIAPILNERCNGCHSGGKLDFDLTSDAAYKGLVNGRSKSCAGRTLVVPGDATHSYLVDKTIGVLGLCAGGSMRYATTDAELQKLIDWINLGAPNN